MDFAELICGDLGYAEVANLAFFDQVGDRAYDIFYGDAVVEATGLIEVDGVDAQAYEGVIDEVFDGDGSEIEAEPLAVVEDRAEFDADECVVSSAFDGFAYQEFIVAVAIEIAGVEEVDAVVQGLADGGDAFVLVVGGTAPDGRHAHAAEAEFGYEGTVFTEGYFFDRCHCFLF